MPSRAHVVESRHEPEPTPFCNSQANGDAARGRGVGGSASPAARRGEAPRLSPHLMDLNPEATTLKDTRTAAAVVVTEDGRFFGPGNNHGPQVVANRPVDLNRLFGRRDAEGAQVRKFEQPWHRNAAYMLASGRYSLKAVAAACDKGYDAVKALIKNPWFQTTIAEIQKENGAGDLMELFKAETFSSLATIVELRDDPKAPSSVRRACAMDIIAQVYGKPTQKVEMEQSVASDDPVAEVARLEEANARLRGAAGSRSEMTEDGGSVSSPFPDEAHSAPCPPEAAAGATGDVIAPA